MKIDKANKILAEACGVEPMTIEDPRCRDVVLDWAIDKLTHRNKISAFHEQWVLGFYKKKPDMEIACCIAIAESLDE